MIIVAKNALKQSISALILKNSLSEISTLWEYLNSSCLPPKWAKLDLQIQNPIIQKKKTIIECLKFFVSSGGLLCLSKAVVLIRANSILSVRERLASCLNFTSMPKNCFLQVQVPKKFFFQGNPQTTNPQTKWLKGTWCRCRAKRAQPT